MNKMFTQPTGPVAKQTNKQSIARMLGIKQSQVAILSTSSPIDGYTVVYDQATQLCWYVSTAIGTPTEWEMSNDTLSVTTENGSFNLTQAKAGDWFLESLADMTGASLIGGLNFITPQMFGAVADGTTDDTTAILDAANEAISKGWILHFPSGTYVGSTLTLTQSIHINVASRASLQFSVVIKGEYFAPLDSVTSTAAWADIPAGTTSLAGDFSAFDTTKPVGIRLNDIDGGSASQGNETGCDFSLITSASSTELVLNSATRFPYQKPVIASLASAVQFIGQLTADAYTIAGDYTSYFSAGDIIRIENIAGTDGVEAKTAYMELVRIESISSTAITLAKQLEFTHVNPWLVKVGYLEDVKVTGLGYIQRLEIRQCANVQVGMGLTIGRSVNSYLYDFRFNNVVVEGAYEPSSMNTTYAFGHSMIDNVTLSSSRSTTDNAVFKVMSSPGLIIGKVNSKNANATGSQGNYGFYVDAIFTPYYVPNRNMIIQGIHVEPSRSTVTRSIWVYGLRDATISDLIGGQVFIQGCSNTLCRNISIPKYAIELRDLVGCDVEALCKSGLKLGGSDSIYRITCTGVGTSSSMNIAFRTGAGTTNPVTGATQTLGSSNVYHITGLSTSTNAITIQLSQEDYPVIGSGCLDKTTVSQSVVLASNVTNPCMQPNQLRKTFSAGSGWIGARTKGGITMVGDYRDAYVVINGYYIWPGSDGHLRMSTTKPTSDNPTGVIVVGPVTKGAAVAQSTGTDAASVAVNALISSLIANSVLASS